MTGSDPAFIDEFVHTLDRLFSIKVLDFPSYFLGLEVSRTSFGLHLCQHKYIQDLLEKYQMHNAKPVPSPAKTASQLLEHGESMSDPTLFRSAVSALQYVTITRPDISFAVNRVCQFMHRPMCHHWKQ